MRFERVRVRAFGPLEDLDTGREPLPSLVAVHAPNEGGKSTFFVLLSSLLYGFYPASREGNPYAPWSGADADADADVRLSGGDEATVHRRLLASPWGRLIRNGDEEDLANRTVPWARHVRGELFDAVFALTLSDLARVDEERWSEIQDRLLGSLGAEDIRSAREVAAELEDEADALWRPDRRGKPRARELQARLKELNEARREARERDRQARETVRTLEERRTRLDEVRCDRRRARARIARARTLGPVRRQLARIRDAESRAGDEGELDGLPDHPGERLRELRERAEELEERVEERERERDRLRERAEAVGDVDRLLADEAAEIRELGKLAGEAGSARASLATLDERTESLERRVRETAREIFELPWDDVDAEAVRTLPLGELRTRVARYRDAREGLERVRERIADRKGRTPAGASALPTAGGWTLLAAGSGLALWASATGRASAWVVPGMVAALAGAYLVARQRGEQRRRREHLRALEELEEERERAKSRAAEARLGVEQAARELPLAGSRLEDPRPELVHVLERLQGLLEDLRQARREAESHRKRVEDLRERTDALVDATGVEAPETLPARVVALEQALDESQARLADARSAREALEQTDSALERLREELEAAARSRGDLEERLGPLGDGDPERGAEVARRRIEARETARVLREELERQHPDLDDLRRRIREAEEAGEEWTVDEEAVVAAEERVKELDGKERELIAEIKDLEHALERLREERTLDQVEGEILAVKEEREDVWRRRDRLALLARLVRTADHRFRERNQPDLLKAAGRHLATVTGGRYSRLRMPERELDGTLELKGPGYPEWVAVDTPVSTGTREQVYLALRLAIVDHLDSGGERLPVFLDEAFVNWDERRRERGFELLAELAEERQIFVFTCHRPMAESLAERGARLLELSDPG